MAEYGPVKVVTTSTGVWFWDRLTQMWERLEETRRG